MSVSNNTTQLQEILNMVGELTDVNDLIAVHNAAENAHANLLSNHNADVNAHSELFAKKVDIPTFYEESGAAPAITIANNTEYRLVDIDGLDMYGNTNKAHGFISFASWFENGGLNITGFKASAGDDIAQASASETWEFSCDFGYIVWKNWGA